MKKLILIALMLILMLSFGACGTDTTSEVAQETKQGESVSQNAEKGNGEKISSDSKEDEPSVPETEENSEPIVEGSGKYVQISQDEAKKIMDADEPAVILDVRTYDEFNQGHIEGALCIPVESLSEAGRMIIEQLIPRKDQTILVYCRSGNRSKTAAQRLADMGYTSVKEFGGINDWKYGTVTE